MLTLDGKRLYLRDHQGDDLDQFHAWLSDPVVARYLSWRTASREESLIQLADAIREANRIPRVKYYFAIVLRDGNAVIGDAGFTIEKQPDKGGIANLGYFLLRPYWGQGYATEATSVLMRYCFTTLGLHKVTAGCDAANGNSEKLMRRCGMVREAYRKKHAYLSGEWRDRLDYALLREDWRKQQDAQPQQ
jgi:ribosomal-protein-alanine N-acetyltransferase